MSRGKKNQIISIFKENNFKYKNTFFWEIDKFNWTAKIFLDGVKIYEASYMWGYVDL